MVRKSSNSRMPLRCFCLLMSRQSTSWYALHALHLMKQCRVSSAIAHRRSGGKTMGLSSCKCRYNTSAEARIRFARSSGEIQTPASFETLFPICSSSGSRFKSWIRDARSAIPRTLSFRSFHYELSVVSFVSVCAYPLPLYSRLFEIHSWISAYSYLSVQCCLPFKSGLRVDCFPLGMVMRPYDWEGL